MAKSSMVKSNGTQTEQPVQLATEKLTTEAEMAEAPIEETIAVTRSPEPDLGNQNLGNQDIDESLNAIKALMSAVEKLQKVRQEVGDIKPLLVRMLDGDVVSGEDLEQLKTGVNGIARLVKAYSDHQTALAKAQVARDLLDRVLK